MNKTQTLARPFRHPPFMPSNDHGTMKKLALLLTLTTAGALAVASQPLSLQATVPQLHPARLPLPVQLTVHNPSDTVVRADGVGCLWQYWVRDARRRVVRQSNPRACLPQKVGFEVAGRSSYPLPLLLVNTRGLQPGKHWLEGALRMQGQQLVFNPVPFQIK